MPFTSAGWSPRAMPGCSFRRLTIYMPLFSSSSMWKQSSFCPSPSLEQGQQPRIPVPNHKQQQKWNRENTIVFFLSDNGGCAEESIGKGPAEKNPRDPHPGGPDSFTSYRLPWANASNTPFQKFKHFVHEGGI